jgi:AraC-like DNA-binding protein
LLCSDGVFRKKQLSYKHREYTVGNYSGFYHYHRGIEILLVHCGKGTLVLNRKVYTLEAGSILIIQPFQLHRVQFEVSEQTPYERTVLTFEPFTYAPYFTMFPKTYRFFEHLWKDDLPNQVFRMDSNETYLSAILERLDLKLHESNGPTDHDQEAAGMIILTLLEYIQSLNEVSSLPGTLRTERHAEKIMQWVEEHYTKPFELDELAAQLHLSKHHVSHLFRDETGSSITDYVIARRIRQACWLLKSESMPIEHVGFRVGIPHFSYFCRLFKKITGLTPKQYRNSNL